MVCGGPVRGTRWRAALLAVLPMVPACGTPSLYEWGSYNASVAAMYQSTSGYDPAAQLDQLQREVEETQHRGKLVPPGVRAHIGVLLCESGNRERGITFLEGEKAAFPESAQFVDAMLARLQGGGR